MCIKNKKGDNIINTNLKEEGFEHIVIYDDGRVFNTATNKFIKGDINSSGYERICVYKGNKKLRKFRHRLVAEYFIPNPENKEFVNHIDGNKSNNNVSNLEWCTQSENEKHEFKELKYMPVKQPLKAIMPNGDELYFESRVDAYKTLNICMPSFYKYLKRGYTNTNIKLIDLS